MLNLSHKEIRFISGLPIPKIQPIDLIQNRSGRVPLNRNHHHLHHTLLQLRNPNTKAVNHLWTVNQEYLS